MIIPMKRSTKIAAAALGGVAVGAAASYAVTKKLVGLAMDRQEPKRLEAKKARVASRSPGSEECLAYVNELARGLAENRDIVNVGITSRDGVHLAGHWYPCENAKRIIVAMHGWRSEWSYDFSLIADFWHSEGCSILFAEQRGQNNSGGDYITFGHLERYDCLDWTRFVDGENTEGLPIYLAGISMGASTVLMAASLELPENVRGIIADCGFTSAYGVWRHVVNNNLHLPYGLYGYFADEICKKRISVDSRNITTVNALQEARVPVAFIHGSDDRFVPVEMTYKNYKCCASPKELMIVPGADHGMSYYTERERYEEFIRAFWNKYDIEKWNCFGV